MASRARKWHLDLFGPCFGSPLSTNSMMLERSLDAKADHKSVENSLSDQLGL